LILDHTHLNSTATGFSSACLSMGSRCGRASQGGQQAELRRCLATTNLIKSPGAGVRLRTLRMCNWRDGKMVLRWAASAYLATEKQFRHIIGHEQLWMLKSYLDHNEEAATLALNERLGRVSGSAAITNLQLRPGYPLC
jgi:hypothetical protein